MNIEKEYLSDQLALQQLVESARSSYLSDTVSLAAIPADYKILFILCRNVITPSGATYSFDSDSDEQSIFDEAVPNFKKSVETMSNNNVHINYDIVEYPGQLSSSYEDSIKHSDVSGFVAGLAPMGTYDSVITVSILPPITSAGVTYFGLFYGNTYYGYSYCRIRQSSDAGKFGHHYGDICDYPFLVTTNTFIHEWMHQLEALRDALNIVYPNTDFCSVDPATLSDYSWTTNDYSDCPHIVEENKSCFYRAVLAGDVDYTPSNIKIGMKPHLWRISPRTMYLGRYLIQNSNNNNCYYYYYSGSPNNQSATYDNSSKYQWHVRFHFSPNNTPNEKFEIYNASVTPSSTSKLNYNSNMLFTRIGPYDNGNYYFINETLNATLFYDLNSSQTFSMVSYHVVFPHCMRLMYGQDCFYNVHPGNSSLCLRTQSDGVIEGNKIGVYNYSSSHLSTELWQFAYNTTEGYSFYPLALNSKAAAFYSDYLRLTTVGGSNTQRWRIEKADNGKFIFKGNYKIRIPNGQYISTSNNNTLTLNNSGTTWTIEADETYGTENYYRIYKIVNGSKKYFDVLNSSNVEGNTVQLYTQTIHVEAQVWKLMLLNDGNVWIVPRLSLTRGLKWNTSVSQMQISVSPSSFKLERVLV